MLDLSLCRNGIFTLFLLLTLNKFVYSQINFDSLEQIIHEIDDDATIYQTYLSFSQNSANSEKDYSSILSHLESSRLPDTLKLAFKQDVADWLSVKGFTQLSKTYFEEINKKAKRLDFFDLTFDSRLGLIKLSSENKPIESISNYHQLLSDTSSLENKRFIPKARLELASNLRSQGQPELALLQIDTALMAFQRFQPDAASIKAMLLKGRIYRRIGDTQRAKETFTEALKICKANGLQGESKILNNLGNISHVSGDYDKAVAYYVESLELKRAAGDKRGMAASYFNIGAIKSDMGQHDAAANDFKKCIKLAKEIAYTKLEIRGLSRIAYGFQEQGDLEQSINYNTQALKLSRSVNSVYGLMSNHYNLAENYRLSDDIPKAFEYYQLALKASKEQRHVGYEGAILTGIAQAYARQNEIQTTDSGTENQPINFTDEEIGRLLLQSKEMAEASNNFENKLEAYTALAAYYDNNNDHQKQASALSNILILKDSVFSKEKTDAIISWESKYHAAEKEREIAQLEADKEIADLRQSRNRNFYIASLILLGLLAWFLYYYFLQKETQKASKKRELFRSKLSSDLHDDVGSILTGVAMQSELLMMNASAENQAVYEKLALMSREAMGRMRDTVWAIDSRKDTYEDLFDRMQDFSEDTLGPTGKSLVLKNKIEEGKSVLKPDIRQAVYLIFKEAISNIVKYSDTETVESSLSIKDKGLHLRIRDFGKVDPATIKTSGTGLTNMKMRAEKLGGSLNYFVDNGFHINVEIPI